jgi:O-antigen ligase
LSWEDIQVSLEGNKQESSDKLEEHVGSISNVSSDASNLERLNRWHCAIELFKERPIVGWGPGTYQFVYAPFQRAEDRTIISTNQGDGGNAHSEYLGPLAEQGIIGSLLVFILLFYICHYAFVLFRELRDPLVKSYVAMVFLGLITYFIHGVLNNYLDTDKASIPFWGFIATIVAIDIYYNPSKKATAQNS